MLDFLLTHKKLATFCYSYLFVGAIIFTIGLIETFESDQDWKFKDLVLPMLFCLFIAPAFGVIYLSYLSFIDIIKKVKNAN